MTELEALKELLGAYSETESLVTQGFYMGLCKRAKEAIEQLQAERDILRKVAKKHLVKSHIHPASGDHPALEGYITEADGEYNAAHTTQDKALDYFIDQALAGQEGGENGT